MEILKSNLRVLIGKDEDKPCSHPGVEDISQHKFHRAIRPNREILSSHPLVMVYGFDNEYPYRGNPVKLRRNMKTMTTAIRTFASAYKYCLNNLESRE